MNTVRQSLLYAFIERYFSVLLALGSSMVLARLLTPEEFGIYSVTLALIGIAHVLRDFGIANYLIQARELGTEQLRSAFGLALTLGLTLCGLLLLAAPWVAQFYEEPRMTAVMQVVALNFAVLPLCTLSVAMLRREMRFKPLMWIQSGAALVNTVLSVALAWLEWGPVSLAWGSVAGNLLTGAGAWWARPERTILRPSGANWGPLWRFGSHSAGAGLVTAVAMDINDLVVAKVLGFAPVAVLSRAQGLMNLVHRDAMNAVRQVAYPAFCAAHREGRDVEAMHVRSVAMVTAVGWPAYGFMALQADTIVALLYGPQWREAASLVPIFCAAGAAVLYGGLVLNAMTAVGRQDLVSRFEIVFQSARALLVAGTAVLLQSVTACAVAFLLAYAVQAPAALWVKSRCLPNDRPAWGAALQGAAVLTAAALALPLALEFGLHLALDPALDVPHNPSVALPPFADPLRWLAHQPVACLALEALMALLTWAWAVVRFDHPLGREPAFLKVFGRFQARPVA